MADVEASIECDSNKNHLNNSVELEIESSIKTDSILHVTNESVTKNELFTPVKKVSSELLNNISIGSLSDKFHMLNLSNGDHHDSSKVFSPPPEHELLENSVLKDSLNLNETKVFKSCSSADSSMLNKSEASDISFEVQPSENIYNPSLSNDNVDNLSALSKTQIISCIENFEEYSEDQPQEFNFPEPATLINDAEKQQISFSENQVNLEEEEFQDAKEFFKDPSSFQYLENINTSEFQPNSLRDSLYVKFDPLHTNFSQKVSSNESRSGNETFETIAEENKSLEFSENLTPEKIVEHNDSVDARKSFENGSQRMALISFDSPMCKTSLFKGPPPSPLGTTHQLYTKEELQQEIKIHELTLMENHLKQQKKLEEENTKKIQEMEVEISKKVQEMEEKNAEKIHMIEEENDKKIKLLQEENATKYHLLEEENLKKFQVLEEEYVTKIQKLEEENSKKIREIEEENTKKTLEMEEVNVKKFQEMEESNLKKIQELEQITIQKTTELEKEILNKTNDMKEKVYSDKNEMTEEIVMENGPNLEELKNSILEKDEKLIKVTNLCKSLHLLISELGTIISELKEEHSHLKLQNEELETTKKKLESELKTCSEDLQSVETTFSNFNKRYEQAKEMLKTYKENEDLCKSQIENLNKKIEEKEEMYNLLQMKSDEMLERANFEVANSRKAVEAQLAVLEAQLRKSELKNSSLESDLKQCKIQNEQLNNMYDDLIKKVSES